MSAAGASVVSHMLVHRLMAALRVLATIMPLTVSTRHTRDRAWIVMRVKLVLPAMKYAAYLPSANASVLASMASDRRRRVQVTAESGRGMSQPARHTSGSALHCDPTGDVSDLHVRRPGRPDQGRYSPRQA